MKISIVGLGRVGSAVAFALTSRAVPDELVLVARDQKRAAGDALDLQHAAAFGRPVTVRAGEPADAAGSNVIVLAAAAAPAAPAEGGSRLDMAGENAALVRELVPPLAAASPDAVFVVVTNPVDVATYVALRASGFPPGRVFGTGTLVDTARLRAALSAAVGIHGNDVRAYVLGEHGDSQFPALSGASAGGAPLGLPPARVRAMAAAARGGGYEVSGLKGYTNYAVATAAALLVEAVAGDTKIVAPVSTLIDGYLGVRDVCVSVPAVVGRGGVVRTLDVALDADEQAAFRRSAGVVRAALDAAGEA